MRFRKRRWPGIARMQLGMLLMLIVPAWSLAFWQAWLYWILSSAAAFATALYFLAHDPRADAAAP